MSVETDIVDEWAPSAYVMNARAELASLRSDVIAELSEIPSDIYLRANFLTAIDAVDLNLQKALR